MKRSLFLVCALVLSVLAAGPLAAQDNPFVGTWKLNLAKSKFVGAPAPKDSTRTVTLNGKTATYLFTGTAADGSAVKYSFDTIYDRKRNARRRGLDRADADHCASHDRRAEEGRKGSGESRRDSVEGREGCDGDHQRHRRGWKTVFGN